MNIKKNKYLLIIIIFSILVVSILYWHINYSQFIKIPLSEKTNKAIDLEEKAYENTKSIKLEKPPFIKD